MNDVITHPEQLLNYFFRSSRIFEKSKTGVEFEKLGVFADSGRAIPYQGKRGIASLLSELSRQFGWEPVKEEEHIIALSRGSAGITLEPGGQLELSGSPLDNIHQVKEEIENHIEEIRYVSEPLGIKWLGLGVQPLSNIEDIQLVPKQRYRIMAPYMAQRGSLSLHMMKKTASVQVNIDYSDQNDFVEKMRTALGTVPFITAIFANSPVSEGRLNGFLSKRALIWNRTDPSRCGLVNRNFFLNPEFSSYIDYALHVPMFFIIRDGRWIPMENITFGDYIKEGYQGYKATWEDWELHLSSIFTEVRARSYIEIRNADCQTSRFVLAVPALWKGILYNKEACLGVWSLVKDLSWEEECHLYSTVPQKGLMARIKGIRLLDFAKEILKIASWSLKEQRELNKKGEDESIYLNPLLELIIEDKLCPAEVVIKNWKGNWQGRINKLIDYCSY